MTCPSDRTATLATDDPQDRQSKPFPASSSDSGLLYANDPSPSPAGDSRPTETDSVLESIGRGVDGPALGTVVGGYRLVDYISSREPIWQYAARHLHLDRVAVVSFFRTTATPSATAPPGPTEVPGPTEAPGTTATNADDRLRRFRGAATLTHPAIAATLDAGEHQGIPYVVTEMVPGVTLPETVQRHGPLSPEVAIKVVARLAQGLHYAREHAMFHGELTPSSIVLYEQSSPKITGLGLMGLADPLGGEGSVGPHGRPMGSRRDLRFTAPEQIWSAVPLQSPVDVYALACVLYWMLNGRAPFEGSPEEVARAHRDQAPPQLSALRGEVPPQMQILWQRMMTKDPMFRVMWDEILSVLDFLHAPRAVENTPTKIEVSSSSISLRKASSGSSRSLPAVGAGAGMEFDPRYVVAIDPGAEGTRASVMVDGFLRSIPFEDGTCEYPTAVWFDGEQVRTGTAALAGPSARVMRDFKRGVVLDVEASAVDATATPPEILMALVLRRVNELARHRVGYIRRAVLTVPGCYNDLQRKLLQDAAYVASLDVVGTVNESTAIAIGLAFQRGLLRPEMADRSRQHWLIVRLGRSSFDATLIHLRGLQLTVTAMAGDPHLGVSDWDRRLAETLMQTIAVPKKSGAEPDVGVLRTAEQARRTLSQRDRVKLRGTRGGPDEVFRLSRAAFEVATNPLLERASRIIDHVLKTAAAPLDEVILTGGGGGIPSVQQMVRDILPHVPLTVIQDPNAASQGGIVWANMHPRADHAGAKLSVQEVNSVDVGIAGHAADGALRFSRIIAANTPLPHARQKKFGTQQQSQDSLRLPLASLNELATNPLVQLGECHIWYHALGQYAGTQLDLSFQMNVDGRLSVFAERLATGTRTALEIHRTVGLTEDQCVRWRDWLDTAILCGNI